MRTILVAAIALGGCYRPSDPACVITCTQGVPAACPADLVCGSVGFCEPSTGPSCAGLLDARQDSSEDPDAPLDEGQSSYCSEGMFAPSTPLISGQQFTVDSAHARMSMVTDAVFVNEDDPDTTMDFVMVLGVPAGGIDLYSARIDPTGRYIFGTTDNGMPMTEGRAFLSTRVSAETWTVWEPMSFENGGSNLVLPVGTAFGASTDPAFGPRRIPATGATNTNVVEYVEKTVGATPTTFTVANTFVPADFGVVSLRQPSYTPNGLRVVFIGQQPTFGGIFTSTRATVTSPWTPAILLQASTGSEGAPYLTNDCKHLYWSDGLEGRHAVHL